MSNPTDKLVRYRLGLWQSTRDRCPTASMTESASGEYVKLSDVEGRISELEHDRAWFKARLGDIISRKESADTVQVSREDLRYWIKWLDEKDPHEDLVRGAIRALLAQEQDDA